MPENDHLHGSVEAGRLEASAHLSYRVAAPPPSGRTDAVQGATYPGGSSERCSGVGPAFEAVKQGLMPDATWPLRTHLEFGVLPGAVPCARLHTKLVLWEWGLGSLSEVAELLTSELMTNAVQATVARRIPVPVRLRLSSDTIHLLIEVWDADPRPPTPKALDADGIPPLDEGGRGLFLVATLSKQWGWYPVREQGGKVVWAEVAA